MTERHCLSCATTVGPDATAITETDAVVAYLRQIAGEVTAVHCTECIAAGLREHADALAAVAEGLSVAAEADPERNPR